MRRCFRGQAAGAEGPLQLQTGVGEAALGLPTSSLFSSSSSASRKSSVTGSRKLMICRQKGKAGLRAPVATAQSGQTHPSSHKQLLMTLGSHGSHQPLLLPPKQTPSYLGLQVGVQQDVAVQVDGKDVTVCSQLQEDRRRDEASQAALQSAMLCHAVL